MGAALSRGGAYRYPGENWIQPHPKRKILQGARHDVAMEATLGRPDISLAVIHKRAKRSELVNNCAAEQNKVGERPFRAGFVLG